MILLFYLYSYLLTSYPYLQTQQSYDDVAARFNETQNNLQTIESQLEVVTGEVTYCFFVISCTLTTLYEWKAIVYGKD